MNEAETTPARARRAGVRDVAALAGVSRQTVSRVLNQHPDVAEATKQRVLHAVDQLSYRMNNAARALGTRRSHMIGILAPNALHYGPSRSIETVESAARAAGYWVTAAFANVNDKQAVQSAVDHLLSQSVDGLVVVAPHATTLDAVEKLHVEIPVAVLHAAGREASGLSIDQVAGARLATANLLEAGHLSLAHIAGPTDWLEAEARAAGFTEEIRRHPAATCTIIAGDWTAHAGYQAAAAVIASGATGVFAANDQVALGLIRGLREKGVTVPHDISVVGFDDVPDAAYYWPPLTTVRQDFDELARRAVARLVTRGADSGSAFGMLHPELIVRDSVAAPSVT
ncbi:LacI family DNA-binding transcriptional regulator [Microbacterium sp. YY-01]|uniref:LacI family DNA-binding transcriptional regulator n=1 Tax=Microbacterium sp. YY-01 TaxID=3421634 RepID=UPI003D16692F